MTPYVVSDGLITPEQVDLFKRMRSVVEQAPDPVWGDAIVSCHHICHALRQIFDEVTVVDGHFGRGQLHSWIILAPGTVLMKQDKRACVIADMYPVGAVNPFLVCTFWTTVWAGMYIPDVATIEHVRRINRDFDERTQALVKIFTNVLTGTTTQ